jgi:hypothetical protein
MGYEKQSQKRRRIDVPLAGQPGRRPARRQVQQDGSATRQAWIDAGIVIVSTVLTTVLLLAISGQIRDTTGAGLLAQSTAPLPEKTAVRPSPQSSPVFSHGDASPAAQPSRALATPTPEEPAPVAAGATDDTAIQAAVDKKLQDEPRLSALGITATVTEGKVMLVGTAPSDEMKAQVEKLVRAIKGVKQVDNQIVVISNG